jgi:uncharacterized protein YdiU (UPF0061 family)
MNSDNMSILGLTLDYGPFGFIDDYDPGFICNHSDYNGRYAFNQQPFIGLWNLSCLAQALLPIVPKEELKASLDRYTPIHQTQYLELMRFKLGFEGTRADDESLVNDLLVLMAESRADYTNFFRTLGDFGSAPGEQNEGLRDFFVNRDAFGSWVARYQARLCEQTGTDVERRERMNKVNPKYVLRNYLAQTAIEKAQQKDYSEIDRLLTLLQNPYSDQPGMDSYAAPPPNWGKHLAVSCSS